MNAAAATVLAFMREPVLRLVTLRDSVEDFEPGIKSMGFGGGTAEIAVISLGGIVASRSVRMAGDMFDQAIIAFIKRKYNLLIGERTAEQIKIEIGSAYPMDPEMTLEIKGRNLVDGLPKNVVVHSEDCLLYTSRQQTGSTAGAGQGSRLRYVQLLSGQLQHRNEQERQR